MATPDPRYKKLQALQKLCVLLDLNIETVVRAAGLPVAMAHHEGRGVTAGEYFAVWNAVIDLSPRQDLPLYLGRTFAHGPIEAAAYALTYSPDVQTGLERFAVFLPLKGPTRMALHAVAQGIEIQVGSMSPQYPVPASMHVLELVHILETIRLCTGVHVTPLSWSIQDTAAATPAEIAYFGAPPLETASPTLMLSNEDIRRPLMSNDAEQWVWMERILRKRFASQEAPGPMQIRVQKTLQNLLPGGRSSLDDVASALHLSRRSLQRHLQSENVNFQQVLGTTRFDLALGYLEHSDVSIEEIAYLLAFASPNSFFRAFQSWTGKTPMTLRQELAGDTG